MNIVVIYFYILHTFVLQLKYALLYFNLDLNKSMKYELRLQKNAFLVVEHKQQTMRIAVTICIV